jgi:aminopeptidase N
MADGQISPRKPVRLADYTAPVFRVDTVALDFDLDPAATFVRATLKLRRQAPGPLVLNGKDLELQSLALNGEPLGDNRYALGEFTLTIHDVPDEFTARSPISRTGRM